MLLTKSCTGYSGLEKFWYSFDMLIPFAKLNEAHYNEKLTGLARNYFYLHQILGYLYVSVFLAGLTEVLKK